MESFRLILFLAVFLLMWAVESLIPKRVWKTPRLKRLIFHASLSVFNTVLTRLLAAGFLLAWIHYVNRQGWGLANILGLRGAAEIAATLIACDFFDYWWHRFNHAWPFLWRFHRAHHADTHVDVTTALRFHPGELFLSYLAKAFWVAVWGPEIYSFILFEALITAYAQFHHANFDFSDAWEKIIRKVHMTPRLHAAHHTVTPRTRNANYSTIFLMWDKLFGTFKEGDFREMEKLGLPEGREEYLSFKETMLFPFK